VETFAAKKGTQQLFYHNDHLGDVNVITDINGAQPQLNEYGPWGAVSKSVGNIDKTQMREVPSLKAHYVGCLHIGPLEITVHGNGDRACNHTFSHRRPSVPTRTRTALLKFFYKTIVHQVFGLELADFFVGDSQEPDHVARVFDGGVDAATEGTHLAFISGFTPVAFCEGG
jgi:hypothetical protein